MSEISKEIYHTPNLRKRYNLNLDYDIFDWCDFTQAFIDYAVWIEELSLLYLLIDWNYSTNLSRSATVFFNMKTFKMIKFFESETLLSPTAIYNHSAKIIVLFSKHCNLINILHVKKGLSNPTIFTIGKPAETCCIIPAEEEKEMLLISHGNQIASFSIKKQVYQPRESFPNPIISLKHLESKGWTLLVTKDILYIYDTAKWKILQRLKSPGGTWSPNFFLSPSSNYIYSFRKTSGKFMKPYSMETLLIESQRISLFKEEDVEFDFENGTHDDNDRYLYVLPNSNTVILHEFSMKDRKKGKTYDLSTDKSQVSKVWALEYLKGKGVICAFESWFPRGIYLFSR